jgi:gentisate 1,2-dioxygenase
MTVSAGNTAISDDEQRHLDRLYSDLATAGLVPLWTLRHDLMPDAPAPVMVPHVWRWAELFALAQRSGELVPVGRGGERRAMALANPGLGGAPFATPTLWAAIQYLAPGEVAPAHRHTQTAFRFVLDGAGVWTNVDGDPVAMRRGDLLLTPGWAFHEHHNVGDGPMAWLDGLDIPLVSHLDAGFFEYGPDRLTVTQTPPRSRGERLWGYPGLRPLGIPDQRNSPLTAYRWEHTDAALNSQLELADESHPALIEPGHTGVRFVNPTTGGDALVTIRMEMRRLRAGVRTTPVCTVGSAVWQVFDGQARVTLGSRPFEVRTGDLFVVPSWCTWTIDAHGQTDLFRFSDEPVYELLALNRGAHAAADQ